MAKIVLDVSDENLSSVITVLNSLKEGLITSLEVNASVQSSPSPKPLKKHLKYQPKTAKVIYEQEQQELEKMGKYINPAEFKKRLGKR